jgi:hydroxymethylpyrimidine pyrophosphatase-like HAD family hydrolase
MSALVDGTPSGFATARQTSFLQWLRAGTVVPVTARSRKVLARVDIEQAPAVCSNGGCIVGTDNEIDHEWHSRLADLSRSGPSVSNIYAQVTLGLSGDAFRHWIVTENDLELYIVIKSNHDDDQGLAKLGQALAREVPDSWRLHGNGNNLAFLPGWLNKRHAVAYLIDQLRARSPDTPVIGVGDSSSDAGFMDLCDFAMAPTNSQLWRSITHSNAWAR